MRIVLLFSLFVSVHIYCHCQTGHLNILPQGKYETNNLVQLKPDKFELADHFTLLPENRYKIDRTNEAGNYRFSVTAQMVFFTSGPLKGIYARTSLIDNQPAIVLPVAENEHAGLKLSTEVYYKYRL